MPEYFVKSTVPYMSAIDTVPAFLFPDADEPIKNTFKLQVSLYRNALYEAQKLPKSKMNAMAEYACFSPVPEATTICKDGLKVPSAILEATTEPSSYQSNTFGGGKPAPFSCQGGLPMSLFCVYVDGALS